MVVNMNNEEQAAPVAQTLEAKLDEIVSAIAMVNWTMQLIQNEFENTVAEHPEVTREQIIDMMKELEKNMNEKMQEQMKAQAATLNDPNLADIIVEAEQEEEEYHTSLSELEINDAMRTQ